MTNLGLLGIAKIATLQLAEVAILLFISLLVP